MKAEVLNANVEFFNRPLSKPLQLSRGLITELTEARVAVRVRAARKEATGRASIYLSDLWAWPDPAVPHSARIATLRGLCGTIAETLQSLCGGEPEHPLELGLRLHHSVCKEKHPPVLARVMCASPFDAAIHDAVGIALGRSAFDFYSEPRPIPSADGYFPGVGACRAIHQILRKPVRRLPAWWIIGAQDSLAQDVASVVRERGYRCFKLKLAGHDNVADVARTAEVFRFLKERGVANPRLSLDSNEGNPDAGSVVDYLARLRSAEPDAFEALAYLEQPTGRDIHRHSFDWREVARLKPVLLDEGLVSVRRLTDAVEQGWSGFAIKTCKGHSFSLVVAAWAAQHKLLLALQDLTNPGLAAIHAALFAAHVPTMNGVELNSPQFTPEANREWLPRLSSLFQPGGGVHRLTFPIPAGLGSAL
ncbi:MAG: hypothetical protein GEU99_12870 [Luteitalea sp.]|nr:hypothetical protein [Luteitalea sp.]